MSLPLHDRSPARPATPRLGLVLAAVVLAVYGLFAGVFAAHTRHHLDPSGSPLFYDFAAFHQAARFADDGRAARAYDDKAMIAAEQASFPGLTRRLPWNYPPSFQLLLAPLGLLPYVTAWLVWSLATYGAYAMMDRHLARPGQLWFVLLAPAAAMNLLIGQNGLLTAALLGGGALLLDRRPLLAGALLGLVSYKPHFAVLAPVLLLAGGRWRTLAAAAVSGAALALVSVAVLGSDPWIAFLHKAAQPMSVFATSSSDWRAAPSVMIMARTLGADARLASIAHWSVAAAAALIAAFIWRRIPDPRWRAGALGAASLLITPYLRVYDLTLLILPIAALWDDETVLAEKVVMVAAWLSPVVLLLSSSQVQLGALAPIALLGLLLRRAAKAPSSVSQAAPRRPEAARSRA